MIFDTHCHYNLEPLFGENQAWQKHWQTAQAHGVTEAVVVGTNLESSRNALSIAQASPQLYAAIGMHPSEYQERLVSYQQQPELLNEELQQLIALAGEKVVAVGETGLDYFRLPANAGEAEAIKDWQQQGFIAHIRLAEQLRLPLIIHVRDTGSEAYETVLSLLKVHKHDQLPFILHCVSGPLSYVEAAVELGAYIGVAGNVTYKNAEQIRNLVKAVPRDRLLLETDAPYLPPQPYRGQPCEPWMIEETHRFLKQELGLPETMVENAHRVFSL